MLVLYMWPITCNTLNELLSINNYPTLISGVTLLNVGTASEIVVSKGKCQLETTIEFELPRFKYAGIPPGHIALSQMLFQHCRWLAIIKQDNWLNVCNLFQINSLNSHLSNIMHLDKNDNHMIFLIFMIFSVTYEPV